MIDREKIVTYLYNRIEELRADMSRFTDGLEGDLQRTAHLAAMHEIRELTLTIEEGLFDA